MLNVSSFPDDLVAVAILTMMVQRFSLRLVVPSTANATVVSVPVPKRHDQPHEFGEFTDGHTNHRAIP